MEILLILLGSALTLGSQFLFERWKADHRRTVVLLALEEELRAVAFDPKRKSFAGFTSQTFDELFADIVALLPPETARDVIRYHLRMKHLEGIVSRDPSGMTKVSEMEGIRDRLLSEVEKLQPKRLRSPD